MKFQKKPVHTSVEFARTDGTLATLEGPVGYKAGDALLTGIANERWPVERAHFERVYIPVPPTRPGEDGRYVKKPAAVSACRVSETRQISIRQGQSTLTAKAGDWLITDEHGEQWVVADEIFAASYQALTDPSGLKPA